MTRSFFLVAAVLATLPVAAADWPQWMGPNRDDVWAETGIVEEFPASGPLFLWRRPIHGGFAGPAVADGKVYVTDYLKSAGDNKPDPSIRNELDGKERILPRCTY
jgi:hypothetical protein